MKIVTFYSKKTGVEVTTATRKSGKNGGITKEGRIAIRGFTLGNESKSVTMMLNPGEAFQLSRMAATVATAGNSQKITHKFTKDGNETTSVLKLEKWTRNGKFGFAVILSRGDDSVNTPVSTDNLLYLGEFCRYLSTEQAWGQYKAGDEKGAGEEYPEPEEEFAEAEAEEVTA